MHAGKDLILATKPFAKEIRWKSWYYTLSTLSILIGLLLGTYFLPYLILRIACSLLAGLVMMRGFIIYHDYQHHSILHNSFPAKVIFGIYGLYMLSPGSIWKRSHDYHHNHNSKLFSASIGSYPILTLEKFSKATKEEKAEYLASRHPLTILFGYFTMFVNGMCIQSFRSSAEKHWDSLVALILHFSVTVLLIVFCGWQAWILTQFIPFFFSLMIGAYLFYAQHNFPGVSFKRKEEWSYLDAALKSSSYLKTNPLLQWFSGNIGFHHVHHLNSRIPFYRLPEAMKAIPALQNPITTSFSPKDILACLRLKVWDAERNEMIELHELKEMQLV